MERTSQINITKISEVVLSPIYMLGLILIRIFSYIFPGIPFNVIHQLIYMHDIFGRHLMVEAFVSYHIVSSVLVNLAISKPAFEGVTLPA